MRLLRDFAVAIRGGPRVWLDVPLAAWQLLLANRTLARTAVGDLPLLPSNGSGQAHDPLSREQDALVDRVAYIIPIMGLRVPWRSDCLVQALAARRWLLRANVVSHVCLGVRKDNQALKAHAWLKVGERIVTGGDISSYAELPPAQIGRIPFAR